MCGDCFVCIYLVCQCDGLELGRRNRDSPNINVARSTIWRLWQQAVCTRAGGIINSPELVSMKNNSRRAPKYLPEFIEEGVKDIPLWKW